MESEVRAAVKGGRPESLVGEYLRWKMPMKPREKREISSTVIERSKAIRLVDNFPALAIETSAADSIRSQAEMIDSLDLMTFDAKVGRVGTRRRGSEAGVGGGAVGCVEGFPRYSYY